MAKTSTKTAKKATKTALKTRASKKRETTPEVPQPRRVAPQQSGSRPRSTRASGKSGAVEIPQRLRIRVRAYENKILDASVRQIMDTTLRYNAKVVGPVPLPTETSRYTVNRSTFVYKDAREQFEMRVHKRLIEIIEPSPKLIDALTNLSLPSGVNIEVKML